MDGSRDHAKWSKSERERQILYDITYTWNSKYDINELICKTETDSQSKKTHLWLCMLSCFSRVILCDPTNCDPTGSSVQGVLQARTLELVAVPTSRASSWHRDQTCVSLPVLHWQVGSLPPAPSKKTKLRLPQGLSEGKNIKKYSHFVVHQKLTQHYKLILLEKKTPNILIIKWSTKLVVKDLLRRFLKMFCNI